MTSKSSFMDEQRELLKRRLWPTALAYLLPFLTFIVGEILAFSSLQSQYRRTTMGEADRLQMMIENFHSYYSAENVLLILIVMGLAVILGMQGFAWIDSKRQLDFYESQPVSRNHRFLQIHINSFLIFISGFVIMALLGLPIASIYGIPMASCLKDVLLAILQLIVLFYATYMMTILAIMLTGNILVACLAAGVFLGYEFILRLMLSGLASTFFAGYISLSEDTALPEAVTSPLFLDLLAPRYAIPGNLIIGTIFLALAFLAYTKRRNETAGTAVVFAPVRIIVKVCIIFLGSGLAGLIGYDASANSMVIALLLMVFAGIIIGCVMEIIYHYDFKALFHGFAFHVIGIALAMALLLCYRFDVTGYTSWVPKPEQVQYASINYENYYTSLYDETGKYASSSSFSNAYMRLTDIDDVNELLKLGIRYTLQIKDAQDYSGAHFSLIVSYKMKNGALKRRQLELPYDKQYAPIYDAVFGSDEFKQGYFQTYHDQFLRDRVDELAIYYNNGQSESMTAQVDETFYDELTAAYQTDLKKFSYSLATDKPPIGRIQFGLNQTADSGYNQTVVTYPVYPSYQNTINVLKQHDLYVVPLTADPDDPLATLLFDAPFSYYFYTLYDDMEGA